jgi:hypothetical protein
MTTKDEVTVSIKLTKHEIDVIRKFCWLRTFKNAIEQLELSLVGDIRDADAIEVAVDDLKVYSEPLERIRSKLANAITAEEIRAKQVKVVD